MDGRKRNFFKKQMNTPFKRKGVNNNRKPKWVTNSGHEQSSGNSNPGDTVYRVLCPSRKIGGVIGKGGNIVKALREETQAKITVSDSVLGCDERVIIIFSSPMKVKKHNFDEDSGAENEKEVVLEMEPCCAAQDALLKVHDRIVEEDLFGGMASDDDNGNTVVTARLLVPNNMVGCLLGRRGDVIQGLRSGTGASIRVLPADHLPACAMATDELVQISGKQDVAKRALYEVSTLLHQNPRKDNPPLSFPVPHAGQNFPPNAVPLNNSMRSQRNSSPRDIQPMPWMGHHGNRPSGFVPGSFSSIPPARGAEASAEFSMKILCLAGKIGGVIGKGGFNVKQLQQETGAGIHVEDASTESDERVIRVSAIEALWNPRSQTIDAILQLQNKTSELSEKGTITTRLLVPSSKVGCILGQGGHVINEMRRRTQADIRVYSKDDKPKCASDDEELVQISGNFGVAKDALAEIASRLRVRTLRDVNAGAEPASVGPVHGFGPARSMPGGLPPVAAIGPGRSSGNEPFRGGGREYEPQNYSVPPAASRYSNMNSALEAKVSKNVSTSVIGIGGSTIFNGSEASGARVKLDDPLTGGSEEFCGSSERLSATQSNFHSFMASSGQSMLAQPRSYQNSNIQQSSYQNMNTQYSPYQNVNAPQSPYQNRHAHQSPYHNLSVQQSPYPLNVQQGAYANFNAPQSAYHNYSAQQGAYQY
ncbi:KH domain-containing protein At4g18375-like [Durio zibethinus]|uniref:KH domain-containing protein At4g18375-like n=1 Tax=Durio zibethinus TaxID=66656 RepID=A0A6P6A2L8_DURZI|nr:KH domain-containing protein At4g18375-like [Durio zibethinus]XP_022759239.1 KH domain-containing protein At4g18375-like [Durio zibethinus]